MKSILFPVSPNIGRFSTTKVVGTILDLSRNYEKIVVLMADALNLYNYYAPGGMLTSEKIHKHTNKRNRLISEREVWANKIRKRLAMDVAAKIEIIEISRTEDSAFLEIFRNTLIAHSADKKFSRQLRLDALSHVQARGGSDADSSWIKLSELYILEEIAVSVRIHIMGGVQDHFYLGHLSESLKAIYRGSYGWSAFDLAGEYEDRRIFSFFEERSEGSIYRTDLSVCRESQPQEFPALSA